MQILMVVLLQAAAGVAKQEEPRQEQPVVVTESPAGERGVEGQWRPRMERRFWYNLNESDTGVLDRDKITGLSLGIPGVVGCFIGEVFMDGDLRGSGLVERLVRLVPAAASSWVFNDISANLSYEYGRVRAFNQIGIEVLWYNVSDPSDFLEEGALFDPTFREFSFQYGSGPEYRPAADPIDWFVFLNDPSKNAVRPRLLTILSGSGYNQCQVNAEYLAGSLSDGDGSILDATGYVANLLAAWDERDMADYAANARSLGIEADEDEMKDVARLLPLAGKTALSLILGLGDYFVSGDRIVTPLALEAGDFRWHWVDVFSHLTLYGQTVKVCQQTDWQTQSIVLSYERSLPEGMPEIGAAWHGALIGLFHGEARFVRNLDTRGDWAEAGLRFSPTRGFGLGYLYYWGQGYTFRDKLYALLPDFLEVGESGHKFFLEVNIGF